MQNTSFTVHLGEVGLAVVVDNECRIDLFVINGINRYVKTGADRFARQPGFFSLREKSGGGGGLGRRGERCAGGGEGDMGRCASLCEFVCGGGGESRKLFEASQDNLMGRNGPSARG
jgi:hypothetical protein